MAEVTHHLIVQPRLDERHGWQAVVTEVHSGHSTTHTVHSLRDVTELMSGKVCQAGISHVVMRQMKHAKVWDISDDEMAGQDIKVENFS